jgi:hypothetical protein
MCARTPRRATRNELVEYSVQRSQSLAFITEILLHDPSHVKKKVVGISDSSWSASRTQRRREREEKVTAVEVTGGGDGAVWAV